LEASRNLRRQSQLGTQHEAVIEQWAKVLEDNLG